MKYSELSKLNEKSSSGLLFNPSELTLTGVINGYNIHILDDKANSEFVLTLFCVKPQKCFSLDFLPKNAILSLKATEHSITLRFSSYLMSQENLPLLLKSAEAVANAQNGKALPPVPVLNNSDTSNEPAKKTNFLIAIAVTVCAITLGIILFVPLTVLQRAGLALVAGVVVYCAIGKLR